MKDYGREFVNYLKAIFSGSAVGFSISGGTTSKTLTVSSDADTKDIIKGDGTAGRVMRVTQIGVSNGTDPATIKAQSWSMWNGDTNAIEDNLGKGGDTGVFALSADGSTITLQNAGISGDVVAIISCDVVYNLSGTSLVVNRTFVTGIELECFNSITGAKVDLTTLVDTGVIYIYVCHLTSA